MRHTSPNRFHTRTAPRTAAALLLSAVAGLPFCGCTAIIAPGETMAAHARGHAEEPGTAPSDGEYVLLHKYVDATPLKTVSLNAGDRLGFMTGKTGEIICVAGEDEWIWTDNDYIWVRRNR